MKRRVVILATVLLACFAGGQPVMAQSTQDLLLPLAQQPAAGLITREQAAQRARAEHGGKVLSVRLRKPNGRRPFYKVKLLQNGNVRVVRIDATDQ